MLGGMLYWMKCTVALKFFASKENKDPLIYALLVPIWAKDLLMRNKKNGGGPIMLIEQAQQELLQEEENEEEEHLPIFERGKKA